jgi:hypothetical protein
VADRFRIRHRYLNPLENGELARAMGLRVGPEEDEHRGGCLVSTVSACSIVVLTLGEDMRSRP